MAETSIADAKEAIRKRILELEEKLSEEKERFSDLEKAESILNSLEEPSDHRLSEGRILRSGRTGLTQAVLETVKKHATGGRALPPAGVRHYLVRDGFHPTSKSFPVTVTNALLRLARRGLIGEQITPSGRMFHAKD